MSQAQRDKEGNYVFGGKKYRSVTTIIHDECPHMSLDVWKERTPDWPTKTRHAQITGTFMHIQLQSLTAKIPMDVPSYMPMEEWPEDILDELEGRMEQWKALGLKLEDPELQEHTTILAEDGVAAAGTWDRWGMVDGMKTMLDWKSSKQPQKSHKIQMGAYYLGAIREGIEVEWGIIAYVRKTSAELVEMSPNEMQKAGDKFLELARKSYIKINGRDKSDRCPSTDNANFE
jgi:CRISPR/Cas system-associated exonuclease Cas4 (RecB family)